MRVWQVRTAAIVALGLAAIAACGDDEEPLDGSDSALTSEDGTATTPKTESTGANGSSAIDDASRQGETIKVGFVNQDEGVLSFPEFRVGGDVAFQRLNDTGTINGATIEVVRCSVDLTPESSIDCANQMVEADVVVAYTGIDLASDAALPIYRAAGIPYVTSNNWGAVQGTADGAHLLHTATEAGITGQFVLARDLGVTEVVYMYEKSPASENVVSNMIPPVADHFDINVRSVGVEGAAPDWPAAVATAMAHGAEMIFSFVSEPGCIGMITAARAADFDGPIVAGVCSAFIEALGDDSVGVYTLMDQLQPSAKASAPPHIAANLAEYEATMDAAGQAHYKEGFATWAFSAVTELATILESIEGDITAESAEAALASATVPGFLGADLNCAGDPWPTSPNNCSATIAAFQTEKADDGSLVRTLVLPYFDAYAESQGE